MARTTACILGGLAVGVATAAAGTLAAFRASTEERRRAMPGDAIVPDPWYITTQAVTVDAPPNRVWPWLAQMAAVAAHGPAARPIFIERVSPVLSHLPSPLLLAVAGLGHRVMQNQQLRGIRRRAEAAAENSLYGTIRIAR